MTIHFINGPVTGEIHHPDLKVGSTIRIVISTNPDTMNKPDQTARLRSCAYRIDHGGKAVLCEPVARVKS